MTENRRIALNIVATYGRSLYAMLIGLFTARWTLMSLGEVDYGLLGVVGGLIGFVAFFNNLMAGAVGRFYAFAVGEAQKAGNEDVGLENCRRWFNVAVLIHTVLPMVLIAIGYPVGVWAVENYLVIPPDRIEACIWVWRFSCIACFMGMVNVPFQAMYTAKQEIAELTIYGFVTTTLHAGFLYYMITHPGFWLVKFSAWTCFLGVVPQLLICTMAFVRYRECRIRRAYLWDSSRMKDLVIYSGGRFICALAQLFSGKGLVIAVNKILGPACNAAMTLGNAVASHAENFKASFLGAMCPVITSVTGSGDLDQMRTLTYRTCKLATFTLMIFAIPVFVEADNLFVLWLKNPPKGTSCFCMFVLLTNLVGTLTDGHWMAIFAKGRVTLFNLCESFGYFLGLVVAIVLMKRGFGIVAVGVGFLVGQTYALFVKLILGRRYCGLSALHWMRRIFIPLLFAGLISFAVGICVRHMMAATVYRILVSTICVEPVLLGLVWVLVLDQNERLYIKDKAKTRLMSLRVLTCHGWAER